MVKALCGRARWLTKWYQKVYAHFGYVGTINVELLK